MPKPILAPESFVDLPFPIKGIDVATELEHQPAQTTPVGQNVRAFEPSTQRARGGARPGLVEYIPSQVLGFPSKIQHLNIIVDPTEAALVADDNSGSDADTIADPSTNNLRIRNLGRRVRRGGSGRQPNINTPKETLVITANDENKTQGDTITFAGTEFTSLVIGLDPTGSAVTITTITSAGAAAGADVGTYPINIANAVGYDTKKFKVRYVPGTMTVSGGGGGGGGGPDDYPIALPPGGHGVSYLGIFAQAATVIGVRVLVNVTRSYFDAGGHGHSDSAQMNLTVLSLNNGPASIGDLGAATLAPAATAPFGVKH